MTVVVDHAAAFLTLLAADANLTVLDGAVAQGTLPPYVLVYSSLQTPGAATDPDKSDLSYASLAARGRAVCHSVGGNARAAREVAEHVRAALLDKIPAVGTRTCFPIRWIEGQDAQRDEQIGVPVFDVVDVYEFGSQPA